jgi:hypothetical protein
MTRLTSQAAFQAAAPQPCTPKRLAPFSLRLTAEERAKLEAAAGETSLGSYIKSRLFGDHVRPVRKARRPSLDRKLLAEALGKLGQSRLPQNMNQIAKAANLGTLPVLPETEEEIRQACYDIAVMRMMLMKALGKTGEAPE